MASVNVGPTVAHPLHIRWPNVGISGWPNVILSVGSPVEGFRDDPTLTRRRLNTVGPTSVFSWAIMTCDVLETVCGFPF